MPDPRRSAAPTRRDLQDLHNRQMDPIRALGRLIGGYRKPDLPFTGGDDELVIDDEDDLLMPTPPRSPARQDLPSPAGPLSPPDPRARGSVMGSMPIEEPPQPPIMEPAMSGLRQARGNRGDMLARYGLSGYADVNMGEGDPSTSEAFPMATGARRGASITMYGDPVEAEATKVRAAEAEARRTADQNRRLALVQSAPPPGMMREDPQGWARAQESSVRAAGMASPAPPPAGDPNVRTGAEDMGALRGMLERGSVGRQIGADNARSEAETFMDPTVTAARQMKMDEALAGLDPETQSQIKQAIARNPELAFSPELMEFLGIGGGGDDDLNVMTVQELREYAQQMGLDPRQALQDIQAQGITVR